MKIALSVKLKLGFTDGTQVKPDANSPLVHLWMRNKDLVITWILNSVSTDIRKALYILLLQNKFGTIWQIDVLKVMYHDYFTCI